jgi:hypothetical protein
LCDSLKGIDDFVRDQIKTELRRDEHHDPPLRTESPSVTESERLATGP